MKKIFFTDLDGTLLDDKKEITPDNYACIQEWVAAGNVAVICTGRAIASAVRQAEKLKLTMKGCYIVAFNGGIIYDSYEKKILYHAEIPMEYVRFLFDLAEEKGIHLQAYDDKYFYSKRDDEESKRYGMLTNMEYRVDPSIPDSLPMLTPKLLLINYQQKQCLIDFAEEIKDWAVSKVDSFFSCNEYLEIVPPGINKGNAVKMLCEFLQIPIENSISAGDAENDIAMLKVTGKSIVMKNADPSMYQYATHITEYDNNHSGVAHTLRTLF